LTAAELANRKYRRKERKNPTEIEVFDVGKILKLD
jgi:hypothetical protein